MAWAGAIGQFYIMVVPVILGFMGLFAVAGMVGESIHRSETQSGKSLAPGELFAGIAFIACFLAMFVVMFLWVQKRNPIYRKVCSVNWTWIRDNLSALPPEDRRYVVDLATTALCPYGYFNLSERSSIPLLVEVILQSDIAPARKGAILVSFLDMTVRLNVPSWAERAPEWLARDCFAIQGDDVIKRLVRLETGLLKIIQASPAGEKRSKPAEKNCRLAIATEEPVWGLVRKSLVATPQSGQLASLEERRRRAFLSSLPPTKNGAGGRNP